MKFIVLCNIIAVMTACTVRQAEPSQKTTQPVAGAAYCERFNRCSGQEVCESVPDKCDAEQAKECAAALESMACGLDNDTTLFDSVCKGCIY